MSKKYKMLHVEVPETDCLSVEDFAKRVADLNALTFMRTVGTCGHFKDESDGTLIYCDFETGMTHYKAEGEKDYTYKPDDRLECPFGDWSSVKYGADDNEIFWIFS